MNLFLGLATAVLGFALIFVLIRLARIKNADDGQKPTSGVVSDDLLLPIRESIRHLEDTVRGSQMDSKTETARLSAELAAISRRSEDSLTVQDRMSEQTLKIANVLSGSGAIGKWGELTLERTLKYAGLPEHLVFIQQDEINSNSDLDKGKPDVILFLPDDRAVVIDAKSIKLNLDIDTASTKSNSDLAKAVKSHIDDLFGRNYDALVKEKYGKAFECTILFLPAEAMLVGALEGDPTLLDHALRKRILLASPFTLLAMLKAVHYGWRQNELQANLSKIAGLASTLQDRFRVFSQHFNSAGIGISAALTAFNDAARSFNRNLYKTMADIENLEIHIISEKTQKINELENSDIVQLKEASKNELD